MTAQFRPLHPFNILKQSVFWAIHLGCLLVLVCGFSWAALVVCLALYVVRMFGITGVYHRYFSHRTYKTSRLFQFVLAFLGATSAQKALSGGHRITDITTNTQILRRIYTHPGFTDYGGLM